MIFELLFPQFIFFTCLSTIVVLDYKTVQVLGKMKKNTTLAFICASLFLLQGCTNLKKTDDSATKKVKQNKLIHLPKQFS